MKLRTLSRLNQRLRFLTPDIKEFCFIIGAMKSGTTTLYSYLCQHPEISGNFWQKEPEYFSREAEPTDLCDYYRQYLPKPFRHQVALEASTGYTKRPAFPNVAKRLQRLPGKKHFVYLLRDPVERIESHMAHNVASGENTLEDLFSENSLQHYVAVSSYALQLDAYKSAFPDHEVLLLDFEELKAQPLQTAKRVCRHIGVDDTFSFEQIPPQNTRRLDHGAGQISLDPIQVDKLRKMLREDMSRLASEYQFNVTQWDF